MRVCVIPVVSLLALACAGPTRYSGDDAPRFTHPWRVYTPEELSRDVVECAEQARIGLAGDELHWSQSQAELRLALRERTVSCMQGRGWRSG